MSTRWHDVLLSEGLNDVAARLDQCGGDTGIAEEPSSALRVDLSTFSVVDVQGEDAADFLQGQLCNDLKAVSPERAQISGYCSPKGRLLATPVVLGIDDGYRLILPESIAPGFVKRLSMFVLRAKVSISERTDLQCSGLVGHGSGATQALRSLFGELPQATLSIVSSSQGQVMRWHDMPSAPAGARYLIVAAVPVLLSLWKQTGTASVASDMAWRLGDIRAGVPSVRTQTQETFVPQMVNLQLIDGLSFRKGCYPGQEIVARMQYLGKLKRHMCLRRSAGAWPPSLSVPVAGDALTDADGAEAGVVVDAIRGPTGQVEMLVVEKVAASAQTLIIQDQHLHLQPLPYALPTLDQSRQSTA